MPTAEQREQTGRVMMRVFKMMAEETRDINVAIGVSISVLTSMVVILARKGDLARTHKVLDDIIKRLQHLRSGDTCEQIQDLAENVADGTVDTDGHVAPRPQH